MAQTETWQRENQRSLPIWLVIAVAVLLVLRLALPRLRPAAAPTQSRIHWVPLERARAQSASKSKPILYDFSAAWCGPCKAMEAEVFDDPKLAETINANYIAVQVIDRKVEDGRNAAEIEELQKRFNIRGFPTLVITDADLREAGRMEGYGGKDRTAALLTSAAAATTR